VKLTTVGASAPHVSETRVTPSRRSKVASVQLAWQRYPVGTRSLWWRHAPDAVAQHRSPLHLNGCCRVAHLFRCSGSPSQRNCHRPHRWWRGGEVRLASAQLGVRPAIRYRSSELATQSRPILSRGNLYEILQRFCEHSYILRPCAGRPHSHRAAPWSGSDGEFGHAA
jgi:hypothetical protein